MEIGAVKQAFNNELILLKKKLNQAKTQIIHKLTRKAKQLTEKKAPDAIKEKFTKKAENAVKEVLILKKIKTRDIGRFIVTHTGKLQDYLNRPQIDNDKACARILLHKAMQDKYKFIKNKFSNIPIKDLFMSRNERLKLKKEEKLKKKEKRERKKNKGKVVNAEGDWDVEDIGTKNSKETSDDKEKYNNEQNILPGEKDQESYVDDSDEQEISDNDQEANSDQTLAGSEDEGSDEESSVVDGSAKGFKMSFKGQSDDESESNGDEELEGSDDQQSSDEDSETLAPTEGKLFVNKTILKENAVKREANEISVDKPSKFNKSDSMASKLDSKLKHIEKITPKQKLKDNIKNRNLQNKILNKKFKKDTDDTPELERKVVDPFFVTATGENYMSIAEPRQPDEIKEEHKQGNRKLRRAVMFGHVPKIKPRHDRNDDNRLDRQNGFGKRNANKFDHQDSFSRHNNKFDENVETNKFNKRFDDNKKPRFNDRQNRKMQEESKPEKLHPSWEAKKKQSGILPFQGKKIVFDES